jgi:peptidoglycan/LPS O-acetylase OafA/YrhL
LARASCRRLGRLSFGLYLVHFPILFTLACWGFLKLTTALPYPVAVSMTGAGFALLVLVAAAAFERWIDRPAIRLSRGLTTPKAWIQA